ncbi:hypothetical protein D3C87_2126010 [compost metagenome]
MTFETSTEKIAQAMPLAAIAAPMSLGFWDIRSGTRQGRHERRLRGCHPLIADRSQFRRKRS